MTDLFIEKSKKLYILHYTNITLVQLARTGPPTQASCDRTGWDTCPALHAPLSAMTKILIRSYMEHK
jgi:hypothetical protein